LFLFHISPIPDIVSLKHVEQSTYDHILRDFLKLSSSKVENAVKKAKVNKEDNEVPVEENKKDE